jgi:CRP-like cAMP-binding protein
MLTVVERVLVLARSALAEAPTAALARLAALAEEETYATGALIWEAGAPADALHLVVDGEVVLHDGHCERGRARAGELVDATAVARGGRRAHHASATRPTHLLRVSREELWRLLGADGELARAMLGVVAVAAV